jgi:hypothetical protein
MARIVFELFHRIGVLCTLFAVVAWADHSLADEQNPDKLSDQRMADSPQALMNALSEIAFMPAEQYNAINEAQLAQRTWPFGAGAAISQRRRSPGI